MNKYNVNVMDRRAVRTPGTDVFDSQQRFSGGGGEYIIDSECVKVVRKRADNGDSFVDDGSVVPAGIVKAHFVGSISEACGGFVSSKGSNLSGAFPLCQADLRNLSKGLTGAYSRLVAGAASSGLWVQPTLCRCRFLDADGNTVHMSSPQLVGIDSLWQCMDELTANVEKRSDSDFTVGDFSISVSTWKLEATIPGKSETGMTAVKEVIVETSAVLDPVDVGGDCEVMFARIRDNAPVCRVRMAGTSVGMSPSVPAEKQKVMQLLSGGDNVWQERLRVSVSGSATTVSVPAPAYDTERTQLKRGLKCARPAASSESDRLLSAISAPNRFGARFGVRVGSSVAWGDVCPVPFSGYDAGELFERGDETVEAIVEVLCGGCVIAKRRVSGSGLSRRLVPLVSYPNVAATILRVAVNGGTVTEIPLHSCGMIAAGFSDDGIEVAARESDIPVQSRRYAGYIVGAYAENPLWLTRAVSVSGSPLSGLTEAIRSRSSWDFGKTHLYAFSSEGIFAVCFNAGSGYVSATRIDRRSATHGGAVSDTGVYVPVSGGLAIVNGARTVGFVELPFDAVKIMWNVGERLLLCESPDGDRCWVSDSGEVCLVGDAGEVVWRGKMDSRSNCGEFADISIVCSNFSGTVSVESDGGRYGIQKSVLGMVKVNGALNLPLRFRCLKGPKWSRLTTVVNGLASDDFEIVEAKMTDR